MTSLELAEITGKRHDNVMRDIKNEIEALRENNESIFGLVKGNALIFELVNYTDAKGEKRPCYSFGRDGPMQLAEGDFPHGEFFSDSTYNDANNQDRLQYVGMVELCMVLAISMMQLVASNFRCYSISKPKSGCKRSNP